VENGDWDAYFDGSTLRLNYNPADSRIRVGQGADVNELVQYTESSLTKILEAERMFPGLDMIVVDFTAI
jgi:hypothetical protein